MLDLRIKNISNQIVTLQELKAIVAPNYTDRDAELQGCIDNAVIWASRYANIPAADFTVELSQDKEVNILELMFDNITLISVKDLDSESGDDLAYTPTFKNRKVKLDGEIEKQIYCEYTCTKEENAVLKQAVLNYAIVLFSKQTDREAIIKIQNDLNVIKNSY